MIFLFPMVGRSSRFTKAGYSVPKYRLELHGQVVFDWVLEGFRAHFNEGLFLFAHRDEPGVSEFIRKRAASLNIPRVVTIPIVGETLGQADSVLIALQSAGLDLSEQELIIFNIDSFRPGFSVPPFLSDSSGSLEVFRGAGEGWSFVEPDPNSEGLVIRTTEKVRISNLCCTGLYTFNSAKLYSDYARKAKLSGSWERYANEFYVAPIYNNLIEDGLHVRYKLIPADEVLFCGVPEEYLALQSMEPKVFKRRFHDSGIE